MNFEVEIPGFQKKLSDAEKELLEILNSKEIEVDFLAFIEKYKIKYFFLREGFIEVDCTDFTIPSSRDQVVYLHPFDTHYSEIPSRVKVWLLILYNSKINIKYQQGEITYGSFE